MVDTSYGRYEAEQKRNVVRACRKMTPEERENLRRSLDKMDASTAAAADDAADAENEPTNITPILITYYFSIIFLILNANAFIIICIADNRDGTGKK